VESVSRILHSLDELRKCISEEEAPKPDVVHTNMFVHKVLRLPLTLYSNHYADSLKVLFESGDSSNMQIPLDLLKYVLCSRYIFHFNLDFLKRGIFLILGYICINNSKNVKSLLPLSLSGRNH
jgi:hypothetical protein